MKILLKGNTYIYAIGDPMQSIFNFTSSISQIKGEKAPKNYNELPINKFANCCKTKKEFGYSSIDENYRSRPNIVNFINNFNVNIIQKAVRKDKTNIPVDREKLHNYDSVEHEVADVFVVLLSICNRLDINLFDAFVDKEKINVNRTWNNE
jgi:ATP-dependent exoDNAse (exonuclease V) beta subunit